MAALLMNGVVVSGAILLLAVVLAVWFWASF
jgi:hypothetical protein